MYIYPIFHCGFCFTTENSFGEQTIYVQNKEIFQFLSLKSRGAQIKSRLNIMAHEIFISLQHYQALYNQIHMNYKKNY